MMIKSQMKRVFEDASPRQVKNVKQVPHDPYVCRMEKSQFVWLEDCRQKKIICNMPIMMTAARNIYSELLDKDGVEDRSSLHSLLVVVGLRSSRSGAVSRTVW